MKVLNQIQVQPGDVFAFGGTKGFFSWLIRVGTWNPVTHVAIVSHIDKDGVPVLTESTTLYDKKSGVQENSLYSRLDAYKGLGRVWWCPLSTQARTLLDVKAMQDFLKEQIGKQYDYRQVVGVTLNRIPMFQRMMNQADYNRMFCSELVSSALKAGHVIPSEWGDSHVTPEGICAYRLFRGAYQLIGKPRKISGFSTRRVFHPEDVVEALQQFIEDAKEDAKELKGEGIK